MASSRSLASDLLRSIDRVDEPIYLVDGDYRLRFVNRACAAWVGYPAELLVGRTIRYDSASVGSESHVKVGVEVSQVAAAKVDDLARAANAICPPPDAFAAQTSTGIVYARIAAGQLRRRSAQFSRLTVDGELDLVLVRLSTVDLSDGTIDGLHAPTAKRADELTEAHRLHDALLQFRAEQSSRFCLERVVGVSPAAQRVRAQVKLAIAGQSHGFIFGPPGSGKQLVAEIIHRGISDAGLPKNITPVVLIDCAALDADTVRAQLAASVAKSRSQPVMLLFRDFQLATADVQVELERSLERRPNNLYVLATSTCSIEQLTADHGLRPQLAALLGALSIELPPLASRRQDIPLLAQSLVEAENSRGDKQLRGFTVDCLDQLARYAWPHNIDELAQCVRAAHAQAEGIEITLGDLPKQLHYAADGARRPVREKEEPVELEKVLAKIEAELIRRALHRAKGNKALAARRLSLTRPKLYRRMVALGMVSADPDEVHDATPAHRADSDDSPEFIEDLPFEETPE